MANAICIVDFPIVPLLKAKDIVSEAEVVGNLRLAGPGLPIRTIPDMPGTRREASPFA